MMEKFTASNGIMFTRAGDGSWRWEAGYVPSLVTAALRELFRAEEDERLGRWRWPDNPNYVVTRFEGDPDHVLVVQEPAGVACEFWRASAYGPSLSGYHSRCSPSARAYFDAHPERKPWEDAKEGEVWIITPSWSLTMGDEPSEYPAIFQAGRFRDHGGGWDAHDIIAARRIWPEDAS